MILELKMKKYTTAKYVTVGIQSNTLKIGFGSFQIISTNKSEFDLLLWILAFFTKPHTLEEIFEIDKIKSLQSKNHFSKEVIQSQLKKLIENNILIDSSLIDLSQRYSRQALFFALSGVNPHLAQKNISNTKVVILGCGGIGNLVSLGLAGAGVGKLVLVDGDEIEESNLTRQYAFKEVDAGQPKNKILKEVLEQLNSKIKVQAIDAKIEQYSDLKTYIPPCDLIVLSADKPWQITDWVNQYSIESKTPFINVGYVQDISIWGPLVVPGKTGCLACNDLFVKLTDKSPEITEYISIINKNYQAPSFGPVNMLSSSHALLDIIKYLAGLPLEKINSANKRLGIETWRNAFVSQSCFKNPECILCKDLT